MNRVRKISTDILEQHGDNFGQNFEDNKKALTSIAVITSKELKNEIAGFITKTVKRRIRQERKKEAELKALEEEEAELMQAESEQAQIKETKEETAKKQAPKEEDSNGSDNIKEDSSSES